MSVQKKVKFSSPKNMLYNLCIFTKNRIDRNLQLDFKINTFQNIFRNLTSNHWITSKFSFALTCMTQTVWLIQYESYSMAIFELDRAEDTVKKNELLVNGSESSLTIYLYLAGMLWRNDDVISEMSLHFRKKNIKRVSTCLLLVKSFP